jgi:hypothetical protein
VGRGLWGGAVGEAVRGGGAARGRSFRHKRGVRTRGHPGLTGGAYLGVANCHLLVTTRRYPGFASSRRQ